MKHGKKSFNVTINWNRFILRVIFPLCSILIIVCIVIASQNAGATKSDSNTVNEYNTAYMVYDSWHNEEIARALNTIETERENRALLEDCMAQMATEKADSIGDEDVDEGSVSNVEEVATESSVSNVPPVREQVTETAPRVEATGQVTQCDDRELLAKLLYREAGGESWDCQVYTCSAILNYCDYNNVSLNSAAHNSNSFSSAPVVDSACPSQTTYDVVDYVLNGGRIGEICFFRTGHYHSFGTPVIQVGAHYFSKP